MCCVNGCLCLCCEAPFWSAMGTLLPTPREVRCLGATGSMCWRGSLFGVSQDRPQLLLVTGPVGAGWRELCWAVLGSVAPAGSLTSLRHRHLLSTWQSVSGRVCACGDSARPLASPLASSGVGACRGQCGAAVGGCGATVGLAEPCYLAYRRKARLLFFFFF